MHRIKLNQSIAQWLCLLLIIIKKKNYHNKVYLLIYNLFNLLWSVLVQEDLYTIMKKIKSNKELKILSLLWLLWEAYSLSVSENLIRKGFTLNHTEKF